MDEYLIVAQKENDEDVYSIIVPEIEDLATCTEDLSDAVDLAIDVIFAGTFNDTDDYKERERFQVDYAALRLYYGAEAFIFTVYVDQKNNPYK